MVSGRAARFLACVFIINGLLPKDKKEKHKNCTKNEQNASFKIVYPAL